MYLNCDLLLSCDAQTVIIFLKLSTKCYRGNLEHVHANYSTPRPTAGGERARQQFPKTTCALAIRASEGEAIWTGAPLGSTKYSK